MSITALVIDGDQVLCQKTATGWLPFGLTLPEQQDAESVDADADAKLSYAQLGLLPLSQPVIAVTHSGDPAITAAMTLAFAQNNHLAIVESLSFVPYRLLIASLPAPHCQSLTEAIQLLRWQAQTRFCSACGGPVAPHRYGDRAMVCLDDTCGHAQYPRIQPCIITIITRLNPDTGVLQILLAQHHRHSQRAGIPKSNPLYGLIAGFVEVGESLEQALSREVFEEVALRVGKIRYLGSQAWPYPSNLMVGFHAEYEAGEIEIEAEELSHAAFFDITNLPHIPSKGSIAFDMIQQIIEQA